MVGNIRSRLFMPRLPRPRGPGKARQVPSRGGDTAFSPLDAMGMMDCGLDGRRGRESATQEKRKKLLHQYTIDITGRTHPPTRWVSDHVRVQTIVPIIIKRLTDSDSKTHIRPRIPNLWLGLRSQTYRYLVVATHHHDQFRIYRCIHSVPASKQP
jgi:hypothetical protein